MGQVGQALQNPNTFAPDPSQFNGSEWATRIGGSGLKGLLQGAGNYAQQNQGQRQNGSPMNFASVPSTPTPMYSTENWPGQPQGTNPQRYNPFGNVNFRG